MTADEFINFLLGLNVQVLELVHGGKLDNVETVGEDTIYNTVSKGMANKVTDVPGFLFNKCSLSNAVM